MKKNITRIFFTAILMFSMNRVAFAQDGFVKPYEENPYVFFARCAVFDDCEYVLVSDGESNGLSSVIRFDYETQKNEALLYNVSDFITDNRVIYYTYGDVIYNDEPSRIYKYDISSNLISIAAELDVTTLENCWNDRYIYYNLWEIDGQKTYCLDLETNSTILIHNMGVKTLQVYGDEVFFVPFSSKAGEDLFICDIDGKRVLMSDIIDFSIIDGRIYYAKCYGDYGYQWADFNMQMCNIDGSNTKIISDLFNNKILHHIGDDGVYIDTGERIDYFDYKEVKEDALVTLDLIQEGMYDDEMFAYVHGVLRGYKDGAIIWEHSTEQAEVSSEHTAISDIYVNQGSAYIAVNGTLYAIDIKTGNFLWTLSDIGCDRDDFTFDDSGNIYISCFYDQDFIVVSSDGTELYREDSEEYGSVDDLEIIGNDLAVHYWNSDDGEGVKHIDISRWNSL